MVEVRRVRSKLEIEIAGFQRNLARANSSLDRVQTELRQTGRVGTQAFTAVERSSRSLMGVLGQLAAGAGLAELGRSMVRVSIEAQSLRTSFRVLDGSSERAGQTLAFLRREADRIGVDFQTLAEGFRGFSAAARGTSLEGAAARRIFIQLTEASRVMGLSTERTRNALIALQQILGKGQVSQEELRQQLAEALPGAMQIAQRAMGVTGKAFNDMVKAGLPAEAFLVRFGNQMQRELGEGIVSAAQQASAEFARLGNAFRDLGSAMGESGVLQFLTDMAKGFGVALDAATAFFRGTRTEAQQMGARLQREQGRLQRLAREAQIIMEDRERAERGPAFLRGARRFLAGNLDAAIAQLKEQADLVVRLDTEYKKLTQTEGENARNRAGPVQAAFVSQNAELQKMLQRLPQVIDQYRQGFDAIRRRAEGLRGIIGEGLSPQELEMRQMTQTLTEAAQRIEQRSERIRTAVSTTFESIGSAISNAAVGVARGTQTISQALENMVQSIAASLLSSTMNQILSVLQGLAVNALVPGAAGGGSGGLTGAGQTGLFGQPVSSGIAPRATSAGLGSLTSRAVAPTIINVANQQQARQIAALEEAQGRSVTMNDLANDIMVRGSGNPVVQALQATGTRRGR